MICNVQRNKQLPYLVDNDVTVTLTNNYAKIYLSDFPLKSWEENVNSWGFIINVQLTT